MSEQKKLSEIDLESLPVKELDVFTLRASVERGVKSITQPWELYKDLSDPSHGALQKAYDEKIQKETDAILEVIINELYL